MHNPFSSGSIFFIPLLILRVSAAFAYHSSLLCPSYYLERMGYSVSGKARSHHGRSTQPNANWSDASDTDGSGADPGASGPHHGHH